MNRSEKGKKQYRFLSGSRFPSFFAFTFFVTIISSTIAEQAVAEAVIWANLVKVTATGSSITRTQNGCEGCDDAAATSQQQVTSGDVYVEFSIPEPGKIVVAGLGRVNTVPESTSIDFGIRTGGPGGAGAAVYENGIYKTDIPHQLTTDIFRVAIEGGTVKYYHNGILYYTSLNVPVYPVIADAAIFNVNGAVSNSIISISSQALCGKTDDLIYTPSQYTNPLLPPAKGGVYVDPVFGCGIKRISDGQGEFNNTVHHVYSIMSPFNSDNTRILLLTCCSFFIADLAGNVVIPPETLGIPPSGEPRWDRTDPNAFYYHSGNQLRKYDLSTNTHTSLRTFVEYTNINFGSSADISEDGNHLAIIGDGLEVFAYRISTDTKFPTRAIPGVHDVHITPNNNVLVGVANKNALYDVNMNFVRDVTSFLGHMDIGRDVDGDEVMVMVASADPAAPQGCEGNGIMKVRISDSLKTCILPLYWLESTHVSLSDTGWVLVSNTDSSSGVNWPNDPNDRGTANPPASLPADWENRWGRYFNELTLLRVDGTQIRRLVHHRTRRCSQNLPGCWDTTNNDWVGFHPYWSTPRAAISRDGRYVVFDSNFALDPFPNRSDYTDAYLIDVNQ